MKDACDLLDEFNINYDCNIVSAHRTPDRMYEYAKSAKIKGIKVIIAGDWWSSTSSWNGVIINIFTSNWCSS